MTVIEDLADKYRRHVSLPWNPKLASQLRTIMIVYEPAEERRLRARIAAFEAATESAGHDWQLVDVTDVFAHWIGQHPYRDAYFAAPEELSPAALSDFCGFASAWVAERATRRAEPDVAVGVIGVGSLFAFTTVREFVDQLVPMIEGRLVVFFPGSYRNNNYRLLEARDGWDYLATPITAGRE